MGPAATAVWDISDPQETLLGATLQGAVSDPVRCVVWIFGVPKLHQSDLGLFQVAGTGGSTRGEIKTRSTLPTTEQSTVR